MYYGAAEQELRGHSPPRRLTGMLDHWKLFPHHGQIRLEPDRLVLEGWVELSKPLIYAATLAFTNAYKRGLAAGLRGQGPSLGVLTQGKPLILHLAGDRSPMYLLVDYRWLTGTNKNHIWHRLIASWLNELANT